MDLTNFSVVEFPPRKAAGFVYVLCLMRGDLEVPFYVGQSQSIWGRLNDYYWAQFQASTDFRIGEAVKRLDVKGIRVVARYRVSEDRHREERETIDALRKLGWALLNGRGNFNYRIVQEVDERVKAQKAIDEILDKSLATSPDGIVPA